MKNHRGLNIVLIFLAMFGVCGAVNAAADAGAVMTCLRNATYTGIEDQPVTLSQGRWEGPPYVEGGASRPVVGLVDDVVLTGDLDSDGGKEVVAMLWQSASGSGNNSYIAVMKPRDGGYVNTSTALLGDRVKLRGWRIDSGRIILDVLQAGESDAMCCPTLLAERSWSLKDGHLEEHEMQVTGKLSLAVLEGGSWRLTHMKLDQPTPEDAVVTLSYAAGLISGKSACNRYSADIRDGERPGEIIIGRAMLTRMACADQLMETESQYLEALSLATHFSFHLGSLALHGQTGDGAPFTALFTAAAGDAP